MKEMPQQAGEVMDPRDGSGLSVRPLGGACGAKVTGIDLAGAVDDAAMSILRDAFLKHLVLVFPGQGHLGPEEQIAFASRWGDLHRMEPGNYMDGYPELLELNFKGKKPTTDRWHSDMSMDVRPPMATFLLGRVIPVGGDTIYANQYLAYDGLSDAMKRMLDGMQALHTAEKFANDTGYDSSVLPETVHPVVRTHPETGRKALYVSLAYTRQFDGMTVEESAPLLDWLGHYCVQPNFTFRHRWTAGDLVIWDNRCLQHYAVADYGPAERVMHRITVVGERPS